MFHFSWSFRIHLNDKFLDCDCKELQYAHENGQSVKRKIWGKKYFSYFFSLWNLFLPFFVSGQVITSWIHAYRNIVEIC